MEFYLSKVGSAKDTSPEGQFLSFVVPVPPSCPSWAISIKQIRLSSESYIHRAAGVGGLGLWLCPSESSIRVALMLSPVGLRS